MPLQDSIFNRFFIGYWIIKTGLDLHPGPFLFCGNAMRYFQLKQKEDYGKFSWKRGKR